MPSALSIAPRERDFGHKFPIGRGEESRHRELVGAAYLEFKVARLYSSGDGELYVATWRPPGWFFWFEIGYGTGEAPSLEETLRHLDATNRRNRRIFRERETPPKVPERNASPKKRATRKDTTRRSKSERDAPRPAARCTPTGG